MTPTRSANAIEHQVEAVIDAGACPLEPTTVVDLTGAIPWWYAIARRRAAGAVAALGL
jgi:tRNA A37 threonylcarbamoyladenosine synthetase subunit TsaC/SUA5/YrdC